MRGLRRTSTDHYRRSILVASLAGFDNTGQKHPGCLLSRTVLGWPAEQNRPGPARMDQRVSEGIIRADLLQPTARPPPPPYRLDRPRGSRLGQTDDRTALELSNEDFPFECVCARMTLCPQAIAFAPHERRGQLYTGVRVDETTIPRCAGGSALRSGGNAFAGRHQQTFHRHTLPSPLSGTDADELASESDRGGRLRSDLFECGQKSPLTEHCH